MKVKSTNRFGLGWEFDNMGRGQAVMGPCGEGVGVWEGSDCGMWRPGGGKRSGGKHTCVSTFIRNT